MVPADPSRHPDDHDASQIQCDACAAALRSASTQTVAFLLLDHLTVPLVGCDDHREAFRSICGLTTDRTATLVHHRPAGGITCPGCRNAAHSPTHPVVPVRDGAVAVLACPDHQAAIVERFRTGLRTRERLMASEASR